MIRNFILGLLLIALCVPVFAQQQKPANDGTLSQRLEVMRQKLDTMRRSLQSAQTGLKQEAEAGDKKVDKKALDTPMARLKGLDKEASTLLSSVNNLRGKLDRAEKYESSEVDTLEISVSELQTRADNTLVETASARRQQYTVGAEREKKKKKKFLGIFGGGTDEYEEIIGTVAPGRDKELFVYATKEVRKSNYEVGRLLFQTIITTYPDSPYLPMAKLAIADSFYLEGSTSALIQAASGYQEWLTFFPTHALADRVALKVAESEMRQVGRPDRDPTRAYKAEQRLKLMMQQYPSTELKILAQERLNQIQDNLGLHNLWVGDFYYNRAIEQKRTGLKGAEFRYKEIMQKYPNFSYMDAALFKLAFLYQTEEETDEAAKLYQRIVRDYPNSENAAKAKEQLELLGATIPEPSAEGLKRPPLEKKGFMSNFVGELVGGWDMTIDKDGVLMSRNFDKSKFEMIDSVIENQGELPSNQIPKVLTTVIRTTAAVEEPKTKDNNQASKKN
ncbi:MAG: outer membrane protein assembly factor BamD [Pyrinomonadaceae bacterium]